MKMHKPVQESKGADDMKYILMRNCPKTGMTRLAPGRTRTSRAHIAAGLELLDALDADRQLAGHHRPDAVRARTYWKWPETIRPPLRTITQQPD
jgi:hypothetical protein